jgi:hypothetical protein
MKEQFFRVDFPEESDPSWFGDDLTGELLRLELFGETEPNPVGLVKVWTGSSFELKQLRVWDGSSWIIKPIKIWDGIDWIGIN